MNVATPIRRQLVLPFAAPAALPTALQQSREARGAVYTRREVVNFILDLADYTADQRLHRCQLLEPSFGNGDFLTVAVDRLLFSYAASGGSAARMVDDLRTAIRAVEIHRTSIEHTRLSLLRVFRAHGAPDRAAEGLLNAWLQEGDFLLMNLPPTFTHVVGNPPYVRQELIATELLAEYRSRYLTLYDRADLYVPFIEASLLALAPNGTLGFICSDRWMKNKYGGPLRGMVAAGYHLAAYIDMVNTQAFDMDVSAYPAITIIKREKPGTTRIAHRPSIHGDALGKLAGIMRSQSIPKGGDVKEVDEIALNQEPWILQSFDQLAVVRRLEAEFPTMEEVGCKVGIGVATGADKAFIGMFNEMDVEPDCKLPLVETGDIKTGTVRWQGRGVINPFDDNGALVDLAVHPKLKRYLDQHADIIRNRRCAKDNPHGWYRTIDRITPALLRQPKLLIPDIKGEAHVVYEGGKLYPHHNLYYITSTTWNLKALQTVLRSGIAKLFVSIYSTQMRGGYLRFQAQYLRRIRLPRWESVAEDVRTALIAAANTKDGDAGLESVFELYRLTRGERAAIGGNGSGEKS
jgi:hypothetical protein